MIQDEYAQATVWRRAGSLSKLPREYVTPINADMDMIGRSVLYNFTKDKSLAEDEEDRYSGTLSSAALQTIMEYTTVPGDVVVTFNAQFGAVYQAAENCGRLVLVLNALSTLEV